MRLVHHFRVGAVAALVNSTPASAEAPPPEPPKPPEEPTEEVRDEKAEVLSTPFPRQGLFVGLGANFGMATANDAERGSRGLSSGPNFTLRLGEAITDWLDLGLGFSLGFTGGDEPIVLGRITALARWYPAKQLFVHTAFGFGFAGGPDPLYPEYDRFRYGDVYVLGVGRHFYLSNSTKSGGVILTPTLTGELGPSKEFMTAAVWGGLEFSLWSGLRKDKLKLPLNDAYSAGDSEYGKRR